MKVVTGLKTSEIFLRYKKLDQTQMSMGITAAKEEKIQMLEKMKGRRARKSEFRKRVALDKRQNTMSYDRNKY